MYSKVLRRCSSQAHVVVRRRCLAAATTTPVKFPYPTKTTTVPRARHFHSSSVWSRGYDIKDYDGVSADVSEVIYKHAHQPQTSVSLQALMRTGRGEFLHKTFDDISESGSVDQHTATELVLIQVCTDCTITLLL
jgi:hypothetical protein